MLFANTGSVGVTHAPTTKHSKKFNPGIKPQISRLVTNHADTIMGPSSVARLTHSFLKYALGRAMPVKRTCTPMTIRVIWNVNSFSASFSSTLDAPDAEWDTQLPGEKTSATSGPNMMPVHVASVASDM
jgi:hypothetical protein